MTKKQLTRKRNKLVSISFKLKGEDQKAVELAIQIIDTILNNN